MRHGRKTKSKRFNGYKRHLAIDLDTLLVLAVAVLPANRAVQEAAPSLVADIAAQGLTIDSIYIDRGYINAPVVDEILARRGAVICRPWLARNGEHFSKRDFTLNMRDRTITCPAGEQQPAARAATTSATKSTRLSTMFLAARSARAASGLRSGNWSRLPKASSAPARVHVGVWSSAAVMIMSQVSSALSTR